MSLSTSVRRGPLAAAALVLVAGLGLTACDEPHAPDRTAGAASSPSDGSSPGPLGASPHVEPQAGGGAPHHNENNAYRRPGGMSPAHARDAEREADRIRPVLKRLWERRQWDPTTVRTALLRLGYEEERVAQDGRRLGGTLTVRELDSLWQNDRYVTPVGAVAAPRVHDDACVTAFLQEPNFRTTAHGPYQETGCFMPPSGH